MSQKYASILKRFESTKMLRLCNFVLLKTHVLLESIDPCPQGKSHPQDHCPTTKDIHPVPSTSFEFITCLRRNSALCQFSLIFSRRGLLFQVGHLGATGCNRVEKYLLSTYLRDLQ